jgi:AcrR family transcriptional regulator
MTLGAAHNALTTKPPRLSRQRARTLEDKDLRRSHLLQAAHDLFAQNDFDGVTISGIAQRAGVAKGTAYLYFNCKEAVFLELLQTELRQWESQLSQALASLPSSNDGDAATQVIAQTLNERPVMRRLLVLLHSVIEPQLDYQAATTFKIFLRDLVARMSASLVTHLKGLTQAQAVVLVMQIHALVISVTQLAAPPPVIAQVLKSDVSLQLMCVNFETFMAATLLTLLRGTLQAPTELHQ